MRSLSCEPTGERSGTGHYILFFKNQPTSPAQVQQRGTAADPDHLRIHPPVFRSLFDRYQGQEAGDVHREGGILRLTVGFPRKHLERGCRRCWLTWEMVSSVIYRYPKIWYNGALSLSENTLDIVLPSMVRQWLHMPGLDYCESSGRFAAQAGEQGLM